MQGILQIPFGMASDRVGRKPMIFLGLLMFAIGGLIAAASDTIWGVIIGRAIQGSGAISAVVMALLTDLTREAHRTRAMGVIGATVGLSFGLAMVLGPLIAAGTGLHGLFLFTSVMALASMALIFLFVPTPVAVVRNSPRRRVLPMLWRVLRHPGLFRLDLGVFLLHLVMVAVFVVVPPSLITYEQFPVERHWQIYLPVILLSLVLMAPLMMMAERRGRLRGTLVLAGAGIVASLVVLAFAHRSLAGVVIGLLVYFTAFNLLEALMPSMVGKLSPAGSRGTAMGVYSSGQFFGAFFGGLIGGGLSAVLSPAGVLLVCAVLMSLWVVFIASLKLRTRRHDIVLALPAGAGDHLRLAERLLAQDGVLEATVVPEDGVIYVTVDSARCNEARLHNALS